MKRLIVVALVFVMLGCTQQMSLAYQGLRLTLAEADWTRIQPDVCKHCR